MIATYPLGCSLLEVPGLLPGSSWQLKHSKCSLKPPPRGSQELPDSPWSSHRLSSQRLPGAPRGSLELPGAPRGSHKLLNYGLVDMLISSMVKSISKVNVSTRSTWQEINKVNQSIGQQGQHVHKINLSTCQQGQPASKVNRSTSYRLGFYSREGVYR